MEGIGKMTQERKVMYVTGVKGEKWKGFKAEEKGNVLTYPPIQKQSRTGGVYTGWDYENKYKDPTEQQIPVKDFLLKYRNYKVDIFVYTEDKSGKPQIRSGFSVVSISFSVIIERKDNGGTNEKENIPISEKEIADLNKGNPWD